MNMTTPTPDLLDVVACALRLAPSLANEDGDLLFSHLRDKFPNIATDAIDVIVTDVCIAAKSGSFAHQLRTGLHSQVLAKVSDWGDLTVITD
jgi:hypothetical protein